VNRASLADVVLNAQTVGFNESVGDTLRYAPTHEKYYFN